MKTRISDGHQTEAENQQQPVTNTGRIILRRAAGRHLNYSRREERPFFGHAFVGRAQKTAGPSGAE
jgi:hypothetical protein